MPPSREPGPNDEDIGEEGLDERAREEEMHVDGDEPATDAAINDQVELTAPIFPAEVTLRTFSWWFQKLPGGGMELLICGTSPVNTPSGVMSMPFPPGYRLRFDNPGDWAHFQEHVAAGETPKQSSVVVPKVGLDAIVGDRPLHRH